MSFARTTSSSKYQQLFLSLTTCRSHFSTDRIYIREIVDFEIFQTSCISVRARDRKLFYTFATKLGIQFLIRTDTGTSTNFTSSLVYRYLYAI